MTDEQMAASLAALGFGEPRIERHDDEIDFAFASLLGRPYRVRVKAEGFNDAVFGEVIAAVEDTAERRKSA